eukprot:591421_1
MAEQKDDPSFQIKYQEYFEKSSGIMRSIPDGAITANAWYNDNAAYHPVHCRIGEDKRGQNAHAWCGKSNGDFITVDLLQSYTVTGIATQGRGDAEQWVTEYRIETSENGFDWHDHGRYKGNIDQTTICTRKLPKATAASFVRLTILKSKNHPSLRFDVMVYKFK